MEFVDPSSVQNKYNVTSTSKQYPPPSHSGRVPNFSDPELQSSIRNESMYDLREPIFQKDDRRDLVGRFHTETPLNVVFFSSSNIAKLQSEIQEQVFLMSGNKHRIDAQNEDDLKLIMRSYYLTYSRNTSDVSGELLDLNKRVIGYASAKIFSELDFYMFYRKDIQDFAAPIANPMNVHVRGTRYGELTSFF
jgi:hypothetical protein